MPAKGQRDQHKNRSQRHSQHTRACMLEPRDESSIPAVMVKRTHTPKSKGTPVPTGSYAYSAKRLIRLEFGLKFLVQLSVRFPPWNKTSKRVQFETSR